MRGAVSGATAWLRRRLLEPEPPLAAVEVRARSVGVVRVVRKGGRLALGAAASLELPPGALRLSLTQPNVVDPDAFRDTLRAALERAGVLGVGRVALVLPDPVARVALLPASEVRGRRNSDIDDMVRFRLRKAIPFDIREARVAFERAGARPGDPLLVAVVHRPVLEGYEEACRSLGLHPGLVQIAGLTLLNAAFAGSSPADRLLVNWDEGYVSLLLARGEWPLLIRTLADEAASDPEGVAREVANTILYYGERLGGSGLAAAVVRSAAHPPHEALAVLRQATSLTPEVLDPWRALGAQEGGWASQALAGAAASLGARHGNGVSDGLRKGGPSGRSWDSGEQ